MFIDPLYLILVVLPALVIGGGATILTKTTFNKYSRIGSNAGLTGAEAARAMLQRHGIGGVRIEQTGGFLGDHYDPLSRTLRLSPEVYASQSLSAIGVACHEAGHAIQHAHHFTPLWLRSALVPVTNFCTALYIVPILIGLLMHAPAFAYIGLGMCAMGLVFALVTLPVEWDASRRAKLAMAETGLLSPTETTAAVRVLNAAFLTYVAAVVSSLLVVLYWAFRLGLLGGRRD